MAETGRPTAKEQRYDRQLRLWGANGQEKLESAHVLLVNDGPGVVGIEVLKNLILPGVGSFTIADGNVVTQTDLQINFFISKQYLGTSRAKACSELLGELNPEVEGYYETAVPQLANGPLDKYTLILLSSHLAPDLVKSFTTKAAKLSIPIISIHSIGFYGYFRISLPLLHAVVDTHPDTGKFEDLRLLTPWPELVAFAKEKTAEIDALDEADHGHIPYVVLLLYYLEQWKSSHAGKPPSNYSEKKEFQALVSSSQRTSTPEGGEENYDEAAAAVVKNLNPFSLPSTLRDIFAMPETEAPETPFFYLASAIKEFHKNNCLLPLPGGLPDMKARSADYVALATLYRQKAQKDVDEVASYLPASESIARSAIEEFCRHAAYIRVLRGGSIVSGVELLPKMLETHKDSLQADLLYNPDTLLPLWAVWTAYLSSASSATEEEISKNAVTSLQAILPSPETDLTFTVAHLSLSVEEYVSALSTEFIRTGGTELHVTSGLLGGMVAQEAVKLLTGQYVPINNIVVWDGVTSRVGVWDMTVPISAEAANTDTSALEDMEMEIETGEGRKRKRDGEE